MSATSPTQEVVELKRWLIDWLNVDPDRTLNHVQIVTPNPALVWTDRATDISFI